MPLWRFKSNAYQGPVEKAFGIKPIRLPAHDPGQVSGEDDPESEARRQVDAFQAEVDQQLGMKVRWRDDGEICYSKENYGFDALRVYAKWLSYAEKGEVFSVPASRQYTDHPSWELNSSPLEFPHLVTHNLYIGYLLPVDFTGVFNVEPYTIGRMQDWHAVASSQRVSLELKAILARLGVSTPFKPSPDDPLADIKWFAVELDKITTLSLQHGLPVIFFG